MKKAPIPTHEEERLAALYSIKNPFHLSVFLVLLNFLSIGQVVTLEGQRKDGSSFPIELSLSAWDTGGKKFISGFIRDITARKQAEDALQDAYDNLELKVDERTAELQLLHEEKNKFISRASHDLRTPIAAITGFSQLLLKEKWGVLRLEQRERLEKIDGHAERLLKIVGDLLSISRIEAGVIGIAREVISINQEIEKVISEMKDNLRDKSQSIKFQNGKDDHKVLGDQTSIHQVLTNLLDNASKYSQENATITVRTEKNSSEIIVHIEDKGIGLKDKELTQVFDEFYRVEQSGETQAQGTGLGLAIVKKLVTQMDGKVWATSDGPGQGSTFSFSLPLAEKGK